MRNWKRRTRAQHKQKFRLWLDSDSDNFKPKLKIARKGDKLNDRRTEKRKAFIRQEIKQKNYYEDCNHHPCIITSIDIENDNISGKSLVDGTEPRSCSLYSCGVIFFTQEEAERRAAFILEKGWDKYHKSYATLGS